MLFISSKNITGRRTGGLIEGLFIGHRLIKGLRVIFFSIDICRLLMSVGEVNDTSQGLFDSDLSRSSFVRFEEEQGMITKSAIITLPFNTLVTLLLINIA